MVRTFLLSAVALVASQGAAPQVSRPVAKVIHLLEEMRTTLDKEHKNDQDLHERMDCWCSTNRKEKTAAISDAQRHIANLNSVIEESAAKSGLLSQEIKHLESEIAKNQQSHQQAQALRLKEQDAFQGEEKDMLETIGALEQAIGVIGKVHGEEDSAEAHEALIQVHSILVPFKAVLQKDLWDILGNDNQVRVAARQPKQSMEQIINEVFLRPEENLMQQPAGAVAAKSYNARSGEILGVLKQMKETFTGNLSDAQKEELAAKKRFQQLSAALTREIDAATRAKNDKTSQLAESNQRNAQAKDDLADTKAALTADQRFQIELEERCATEDNEFAERQQTRAEEIKAVGETIGFLTNDDARDLFSRTFSFLQNSHGRKARYAAAAKLLQLAKKTKNINLASLAMDMKLDSFTRVKKAMDDMMAQLKREQKDEYEHREWCNKEIDTNEDSVAAKKRTHGDLESTIEDLNGKIETVKNDQANLNNEISEMHTQLKRAGEDRAAENKEFQTTIADQRATVQILNKAVKRLEKFYSAPASPAKSLVQKDAPQNVPGRSVNNEAAPAQATYSKHGSSSGVIGLIKMIISDAGRMEQDALKMEQESQTAYAAFVTNTNVSVRAKQEQLVNKATVLAQAQVDAATNKKELTSTIAVLEKLANYNGELHRSCDFVLQNFDARQKARGEEIEAIQEAKAILSGSNFDADQ
eukprot:GEMP01027706.1.p1 GENE.GEMP01027706.1~~GEMP01027706.1.p1  ORF type:complete len:700 (+),score=206.05 GEMP01027706.1:170-2269(+)